MQFPLVYLLELRRVQSILYLSLSEGARTPPFTQQPNWGPVEMTRLPLQGTTFDNPQLISQPHQDRVSIGRSVTMSVTSV